MARCGRTEQLAVYHRRRDGGNVRENAIVLCRACREHTAGPAEPGPPPPPFSYDTELSAYHWARYQCQCTADCPGCLVLSGQGASGRRAAS